MTYYMDITMGFYTITANCSIILFQSVMGHHNMYYFLLGSYSQFRIYSSFSW